MCDKHVAYWNHLTSIPTLEGLGSWSWSFNVKEMMLRHDKTQMVFAKEYSNASYQLIQDCRGSNCTWSAVKTFSGAKVAKTFYYFILRGEYFSSLDCYFYEPVFDLCCCMWHDIIINKWYLTRHARVIQSQQACQQRFEQDTKSGNDYLRKGRDVVTTVCLFVVMRIMQKLGRIFWRLLVEGCGLQHFHRFPRE